MTTSAPQWPDADSAHEQRDLEGGPGAGLPPLLEQPASLEQPALLEQALGAGGGTRRSDGCDDPGTPKRTGLRVVPDGRAGTLQPVRGLQRAPAGPKRTPGRRSRFVLVRDPAEIELVAARRRARPGLPSPAAVTRDVAMALLEVEAGCRSAAQLERIFSPELWEMLEHRIVRRGGPLPSGHSLIRVRCQEDMPGLADTVAVVQRGDRVRPVAIRLDAGGGRWTVTELRWWRNETETTASPGRDRGGG